MKKSEQEKNVRNVFIFLIVVLVIITLIFIYREITVIKEANFIYNNVEFKRVNEGGLIRYRFPIYVNNADVPFFADLRNNPKDLEDIEYEPYVKNYIIGKKDVYITMDKNSTGISVIAYTSIKQFLGNPSLWGINSTGTFTEKVGNYLMKTCEDTSETEGIVKFQIGEENRIYSEDECVILEYKNEDELIRVAERFDLILLGVLK